MLCKMLSCEMHIETYFEIYSSSIGVWNLARSGTISQLILDPYAWTVNFEICRDVQLTTHQPPMRNSSQTSAWSHRYIGRGIGKTEDSPTGFRKNFSGLNGWKKPLPKVVDFEPLGALFGPGAPDADLAPFRKWFCELQIMMHSQKPYFYNADRTFRRHVQSISTPKPL